MDTTTTVREDAQTEHVKSQVFSITMNVTQQLTADMDAQKTQLIPTSHVNAVLLDIGWLRLLITLVCVKQSQLTTGLRTEAHANVLQLYERIHQQLVSVKQTPALLQELQLVLVIQTTSMSHQT